MNPAIGLLLFMGMFFFILIIIVAVALISRGSSAAAGAKTTVIDFSRYADEGRIVAFRPHRDFLTREWMIATQDRNKVVVRERGLIKRPEHTLDKSDMKSFTDETTGFTLVINGLSHMKEAVNADFRKLQKQLDQALSEKSVLKAENMQLNRHRTKEAMKLIEVGETMNVKMRPYVVDRSKKS